MMNELEMRTGHPTNINQSVYASAV